MHLQESGDRPLGPLRLRGSRHRCLDGDAVLRRRRGRARRSAPHRPGGRRSIPLPVATRHRAPGNQRAARFLPMVGNPAGSSRLLRRDLREHRIAGACRSRHHPRHRLGGVRPRHHRQPLLGHCIGPLARRHRRSRRTRTRIDRLRSGCHRWAFGRGHGRPSQHRPELGLRAGLRLQLRRPHDDLHVARPRRSQHHGRALQGADLVAHGSRRRRGRGEPRPLPQRRPGSRSGATNIRRGHSPEPERLVARRTRRWQPFHDLRSDR